MVFSRKTRRVKGPVPFTGEMWLDFDSKWLLNASVTRKIIWGSSITGRHFCKDCSTDFNVRTAYLICGRFGWLVACCVEVKCGGHWLRFKRRRGYKKDSWTFVDPLWGHQHQLVQINSSFLLLSFLEPRGLQLNLGFTGYLLDIPKLPFTPDFLKFRGS